MSMSKNKFNNDIYSMYLEEYEKNKRIEKENKRLKLDLSCLKSDFNKYKKETENKLNNAYDELNRLKEELDKYKQNENNKDYKIDKLTNQVTKDSTNSSIPTSKEIGKKHKTGTNTYNHREKKLGKNGGQFGHAGKTLTKEEIEKKIEDNKIKVIEKTHYIHGKNTDKPIIKYQIGIENITYVIKNIFIKTPESNEVLPKKFYSDVIYDNSIKALITMMGNYLSIGYNKIKEFICDLTNNVIDISEGTIDNIYADFSNKSQGTLNNITNNIINGTYQHTDETVTKENGKEVYYRGYANKYNVLYKYHHNKGDKPIKEDNILTKYMGTIISDHDTAIFKYGLNNQDCIVHIGRYCMEEDQNVNNINWPICLYKFLLKVERNREILSKFGRSKFSDEEIELIEKEYDEILDIGVEQNKNIESSYWKDKSNTLLRRMRKYKNSVLFYTRDFEIPADNNFIERALRMIKGKTKVSGGFRSNEGGIRFGNTMSIIKTAKLRNMNPFKAIKEIYDGKELFA